MNHTHLQKLSHAATSSTVPAARVGTVLAVLTSPKVVDNLFVLVVGAANAPRRVTANRWVRDVVPPGAAAPAWLY